jgi:hypothetical protein
VSTTTKLTALVAFVVLADSLWYYIKVLLYRNGREVSWLWRHFRDIPNFLQLIAETEDARTQAGYGLVLLMLVLSIIGLFATVLSG